MQFLWNGLNHQCNDISNYTMFCMLHDWDYPSSLIWQLIYLSTGVPFYPRLVLAFGYCRCLRLCVCVSVCVYQSRACPHDNLPFVQARITKFGTKVQMTLVKVPIVFGDDRRWPSRSNLTWKSNLPHFELVLPITHQPFKLYHQIWT